MGLITPQTLARFQSNWQANKPNHITGNLIILQTDAADRVAGGATSPYVAENPSQGVYVYLLDDYKPVDLPSGGFRFNQTRDTGLFSSSVRYQANGAFVDDWLKTFGINLSKDLVVFAVGTGNGISGGAYPAKAVGAGAVQDVTRGVYWLRYWGADIKNLAILNGNLNKKANGAGIALSASRSGINLERNAGFSVKQLRVDNTVLTLGLEDIYEIAKAGGAATISGLTTKQQIIDARPAAQYDGTAQGLNVARNALVTNPAGAAYITTSYQSSGAPSASAGNQTFVPFEVRYNSCCLHTWNHNCQSMPYQFRSTSEWICRETFFLKIPLQECFSLSVCLYGKERKRRIHPDWISRNDNPNHTLFSEKTLGSDQSRHLDCFIPYTLSVICFTNSYQRSRTHYLWNFCCCPWTHFLFRRIVSWTDALG